MTAYPGASVAGSVSHADMKTCRTCGEPKSRTLFSKRADAADGLWSQCKACKSACAKAYRQANTEKVRENERAYYQANVGKIAKRKRAYYQANVEKEAERNRAYRQANVEKVAERNRAYRQANAEKVNGQIRAWKQANPGRVAAFAAARRVTCEMQMPAWSDPDDIALAYAYKQAWQAATGVEMHLDHVVPLKPRSKKVVGFHCVDNLRIVPAEVNLQKSDRHWPHEVARPGALQ